MQIRRVTLDNPLATPDTDKSDNKHGGGPKKKRERSRSAPAWLKACRRSRSLADVSTRRPEAALRRPYTAPPAKSTQSYADTGIPDEVDHNNPCFTEARFVEHYDPAGTSPLYIIIIEDGTMTKTELNYVRETTRQMALATTRHCKQLHMVFVEDDRLRELREEINGHLAN